MGKSLLDQIEFEAMEGQVVKALRRCLALGGRAGNSNLRNWARQELEGYEGNDLPEYRKVKAPLCVDFIQGNHLVGGGKEQGNKYLLLCSQK